MIETSHVEIAEPGTQPDHLYPPYVSTITRSQRLPLVLLPKTLTERTGPAFGHGIIGGDGNHLTSHHGGDPVGERI